VSQEKYRILYVDDEIDNLIIFKAAFRRYYEVFTSTSAREGMEILKNQDIQVLITDQRMPEITGVEFLENVIPDYPETIRMILTGFSDVEAIIQAINKGRVYQYITKPWDTDELKITIDNALESYRLKNENRQLIRDLKDANQRLEEYAMDLERKVEERTTEIKHQKEIIEKKNDDITASINYAKHIQRVVLPEEGRIAQAFQQSFILFKPRDIVSGDFYWFQEKLTTDGKEKTIITAVDCTGHGVPGAFMSLIANEILSEIVNEKGVLEADKILNELHKSVRKVLKQDQSDNRDGMDMSLCVIDKESKTIEFAGAKNSLIYVQNGEINAIKGDKFPIGGLQHGAERIFNKQIISYATSPIACYILSDGYQDQFGGVESRKFHRQVLKELLFQNHHLEMGQQKKILEETLKQWMKVGTPEEEHQVDDILIIGFTLA
jgi:serine phosphatase RsbU (regulator of sigma subunit)